MVVLFTACAEPRPTEEHVSVLLEAAEERLLDLWIDAERAAWIHNTFVTTDTAALASDAKEAVIEATVELAVELSRFDGQKLPAGIRRKLLLLKTSREGAVPSDPVLREEIFDILAEMERAHGQARYCLGDGQECLTLFQAERVFAETRDTDELVDLWTGWRGSVSPSRSRYARFVELANAGSVDLGFSDIGELWRSGYDMTPGELSEEVQRLWTQLKPLYESMHCYVRSNLSEEYGTAMVPLNGSIPAHLLGDLWGNDWTNIFAVVAPTRSNPWYDLTRLLEANSLDALEMVQLGEGFFTSIGFDPLPLTFWQRSVFVEPTDREIICHPSAWTVDHGSDIRIKMCLDVESEDFITLHGELGRNYYQRAYRHRTPLYRTGANDAFHEAVSGAIALSITPEYLTQVGLLDQLPPNQHGHGIDLLLRLALDKLASLPFSLVVDQWRWKVFSGEFEPEEYNEGWWALRTEYQGLSAPVPRHEGNFDFGSHLYITADIPFIHHFLANILQFQFHRALCTAKGFDGPLHSCSIFGSLEAGYSLKTMFEFGASRPWQDALEAVTGERHMDATAVLDYFSPLQAWLEERNAGKACGW